MLLPLFDLLLYFILIAAPLMYGAVDLRAQFLLAFLSFLLFHLIFAARPWALKAVLKSPWGWLGGGMLLFVLVQLIPIPAGMLKVLSPAAYDIYARYSPGGIQPGSMFSLSLYPSDTVRGLMVFSIYGLIFLSVRMRLLIGEKDAWNIHSVSLHKLQYLKLGCLMGVLSLLSHSLYDFNLHIPANGIYFVFLLALASGAAEMKYDHLFFQRAVRFVVVFGFLVAVFAILQKFNFNGMIYRIGMKATRPVGPYYNYDHYAGFMELCGAVAVAMVIACIAHASFVLRRGMGGKILWLSTPEADYALRYLFMTAIMVATIFMTTSRGGIMSFFLSQVVFFFLVFKGAGRVRKEGRVAAAFITVILLAGIMVVWLGPEEFLERFHLLFLQDIIKMEGPINPRLLFYKDTLHVIRDFPLVGTGLNTFGTNFAHYRTFDFTADYLRHTHNDYLQLISETGVGGVAFLILFFNIFLFYTSRVVRNLR